MKAKKKVVAAGRDRWRTVKKVAKKKALKKASPTKAQKAALTSFHDKVVTRIAKLNTAITLRSVLNDIDAVLSGDDFGLARDLWSVLSALRGPDVTHVRANGAKLATTAIIRQAAFPKTGGLRPLQALRPIPATFAVDNVDSAESRAKNYHSDGDSIQSIAGCHFTSHAQIAFGALGLSWNTKN